MQIAFFYALLFCHLWHVWLYRIFPHYLEKRQDFRKKVIEHKNHHFIFCTTCVWTWVRIKRVITVNVKWPLFLSDYNEIWIFSTDFQKIPPISNFVEIRPVGVDFFLMHTDGWTETERSRDTTKLLVTFRKFAKASEDSQASAQKRLTFPSSDWKA